MSKGTKILLSVAGAVAVSAAVAYVCVNKAMHEVELPEEGTEGNYSWKKNGDVYVCKYQDGEHTGEGKSTKLESAKRLALIQAMRIED